jgi:outer membrane receptor protein involved in Fe transport
MPVSHPKHPSARFLARTPVATAVMLALGSPAALAQESTTLGEVLVTAQKREESLQNVPISLQSLNTETLEQLNVQNFREYVQFLPTVSTQLSPGAASGFNLVYMRGIATGGDGQATTSQPSVGMYLDEQPITTVQGNLDVHLYDIARVEALAGPQGTLYGASSQAGTIRIITNKPDPSGFAGGYSLEGNYVDGDDAGYVAEGFVNIPVGENAAIRLVGWATSEAGWIDNVPVTRLYEGDPETTADNFVANNAEFVKDNYNTVDKIGARAALRVNLNDSWAITPSLMYQKTEQRGSWGDDRSDFVPGDQAVGHFRQEYVNDKWYQAGLTIEGSISNFDVVYSGNYLDREVDGAFDYSDYSYWYNVGYTYFSSLFQDDDGNQLDPSAAFTNDDQYSKQSHELRISTPQDNRVRGLLGLFYQKQKHDFYQEFGRIEGLGSQFLMNEFEPGAQQFPGVVYLNSMDRVDTDRAVFGNIAFDITDDLELTLGARYFKPEVTVKGFFGFGLGYNPPFVPTGVNEPGNPANGGDGAFSPAGRWWSSNGEWRCPSQADYKDAPCQNVDKAISESDWVGRVNLSWQATETAMLYATWSEGYRPGGINRNPFLPDYISDFLTNWEAGWKTRWLDDRLQFNGAVFLEEWDDVQISFQGLNGITQVDNGPKAEVAGIEAQLDWLATDRLRIGVALAYYDSKLKDPYCDDLNNSGACEPGEAINAPSGTSLPVTPDFKGNLITRYTFPLGGFEAHTQGALVYQTSRASTLNIADNDVYGDIPSSTILDLAFGITNDKYGIELFVSNVTDEDAALYVTSQCTPQVCGRQSLGVQARPRTIGLRFKQSF